MLVIILLTSLLNLSGQGANTAQPVREPVTQAEGRALKCSQPTPEQDALIREAAENQYLVRRVEFSGNERTRDNVLRREIILQEGEVFTRENLARSLESVSRLKRIIYPVKLGDVILHLGKPEKIIDMTICFRERPRHRTKRSFGKRAS
jgi:hypothetical protein